MLLAVLDLMMWPLIKTKKKKKKIFDILFLERKYLELLWVVVLCYVINDISIIFLILVSINIIFYSNINKYQS
jgi:hypothetical protein